MRLYPGTPRTTNRPPVLVCATAAVCAALLTASCGPGQGRGLPGPSAPAHGSDQPGRADRVERLTVRVLEVLPHDKSAFTQGLELDGNTLYESTGMAGRSSVRSGHPDGTNRLRVALPRPLFGEGLTVLGPTLWQLTWRDGVAIERDARTLAERRRVRYSGEGWGLCHQAARGRLVMSDGSARLAFRDPRTFVKTGEITVTSGGEPVPQLNELECVGDTVYANIWSSDQIMRIDANTGKVTGRIDASGLLTPPEASRADVLNGVAAVPGTDEFLITGKLWPKTFRVVLVPAPSQAPAVDGGQRQ
ncbi:glutaminyl-peptide cyclotransferase [Streptomyces sp. NPDC059828]|uniref:glutaminyl-peptide cyclotransferase n=1 Tax=Streptomyces sp. NPDC059828 TaxID=3346965 RepID=UPI0036659121